MKIAYSHSHTIINTHTHYHTHTHTHKNLEVEDLEEVIGIFIVDYLGMQYLWVCTGKHDSRYKSQISENEQTDIREILIKTAINCRKQKDFIKTCHYFY